jgi:hypothetical protein
MKLGADGPLGGRTGSTHSFHPATCDLRRRIELTKTSVSSSHTSIIGPCQGSDQPLMP